MRIGERARGAPAIGAGARHAPRSRSGRRSGRKYLRALEDEEWDDAAEQRLREGLPAHLRRAPRPRRRGARRRVPPPGRGRAAEPSMHPSGRAGARAPAPATAPRSGGSSRRLLGARRAARARRSRSPRSSSPGSPAGTSTASRPPREQAPTAARPGTRPRLATRGGHSTARSKLAFRDHATRSRSAWSAGGGSADRRPGAQRRRPRAVRAAAASSCASRPGSSRDQLALKIAGRAASLPKRAGPGGYAITPPRHLRSRRGRPGEDCP